MQYEIALSGGRTTEGVVRVGNTVRRPVSPNGEFSHRLLLLLEEKSIPAVPRFLGIDEKGRESLSFVEGAVPADLRADWSDRQLGLAVQIMRRLHDATAGSNLAGTAETVCHNDLSPCNYVFRHDEPVGLVDFDAATPGTRLADLAYAVWMWLDLGSEEVSAKEQGRRIKLMRKSYGLDPRRDLLEMIGVRQRETAASLQQHGDREGAEWAQRENKWLLENMSELRG